MEREYNFVLYGELHHIRRKDGSTLGMVRHFYEAKNVVDELNRLYDSVKTPEVITDGSVRFGDLDLPSQLALFECWINGQHIEERNTDSIRLWTWVPFPSWSYNAHYRIQLKPEVYRVRKTDGPLEWEVFRERDNYVVSFCETEEAANHLMGWFHENRK